MEIDFLGLNLLPKYEDELQKDCKESFIDSANKEEVETSLSLGSSCSSYSSSVCRQRGILNLDEKKITCELFPCDKKIASYSCSGSNNKPYGCHYNNNNVIANNVPKTEQPNDQLVLASNPVFYPTTTTDGCFTYIRNGTSIDLRPPLRLDLYSSQANDAVDYHLPDKANNNTAVYMPRDQSLDRRKSNRGHIPTVAMARKATLTRFLKKRSHRMNQARSYLVIEGSPQMHGANSESASTGFNSCKNNKDNISR